jgi:hypothetical protein
MKFFRKTEVCLPTRAGAAVIFLILGLIVFGGVLGVYPYLAKTAPQPDAKLLIVEGWLKDDALSEVLFDVQPGQRFVTTGGPITYGRSLFNMENYADLTVERLLELGIEPEKILSAPAPLTDVDRTYTSALAVRRTLEEQGLFGVPCNVYSMGAHARRSHSLYKAAFGSDYPIGIISMETSDIDLRHWWSSSEAFKSVLNELFSLFYTRCSFWKYRGPESSGHRVGEEE